MQIFIAIVSVICNFGQFVIKCLEYIDKKRKDKNSALIDRSEQTDENI